MVNLLYIYSQVLTNYVKRGNFPDILRYADITPVFKKVDATEKTNCRPINTLSNFSKVFEKLIYAKINSFMEPKLSKYLGGFGAKHNIQHTLLNMTETWRAMPSNGYKVGAILMDFFKHMTQQTITSFFAN